jgi:hypothetical protein
VLVPTNLEQGAPYNIVTVQGQPFDLNVTWMDTADPPAPIPLSGYRAHMQIRTSTGGAGKILADLSSEGGTGVLTAAAVPPTIPLTISTANTFSINDVEADIAPGTYSTVQELGDAVAAALDAVTGTTTVATVSGGRIVLTDPALIGHALTVWFSFTDALGSLGITVGQTFASSGAALTIEPASETGVITIHIAADITQSLNRPAYYDLFVVSKTDPDSRTRLIFGDVGPSLSVTQEVP